MGVTIEDLIELAIELKTKLEMYAVAVGEEDDHNDLIKAVEDVVTVLEGMEDSE